MEKKELWQDIFLFSLLAFAIIALCISLNGVVGFLPSFSIEEIGANILIEPNQKNLGDVSFTGGLVNTSAVVKNIGSKNLVIESIKTSCMCTSAKLIFTDENGKETVGGDPVTIISGSWKIVIPPGQTANLEVSFDPTKHPDYRGALTRIVTIYSNDKQNPESKMILNINQVD